MYLSLPAPTVAMAVRSQCTGVAFLLLPYGLWGQRSGVAADEPSPVPAETSHLSLKLLRLAMGVGGGEVRIVLALLVLCSFPPFSSFSLSP